MHFGGMKYMIGSCGADDIASVNYLYDTNRNVGAGFRTYWCDGTAAQTWNRCMFQYCLDCVNPESPTFYPDSTTALYDRIDIFRNPPGHTFMQPDAVHGCVSRYGASLSHVASTEEWSSKVAANCKSGTEAIHTSNDISGSEETTYGRCTGRTPAPLLARNTAY